VAAYTRSRIDEMSGMVKGVDEMAVRAYACVCVRVRACACACACGRDMPP